MKFGPVPVGQSVGGIVAHAVRLEGLVLKKGHVVTPEHVERLRAAGVDMIVVAQLDEGDVGEDAAALALAKVVAGAHLRVDPPFTGRSNLHAETDGVLVIDTAAIDRLNAVDERITVATLPAFRTVVEGEMVGTVKIIPFAVPGKVLGDAIARVERPPVYVAPFQPLKVGVISTLLPGLKPSVIDKTLRILDTRLAPAAARIVGEERVPHDSAAIEAAGGRVEHFGMPVDPGNLLLLGRLADGRPVLGAPGCARSPKENGFDWVLHRLLAGLPVGSAEIAQLGVGGLLMEIVSRPQPRAGSQAEVEDRAGE